MFLFINYLLLLISHTCLATIDQNNCRLEGEKCVKNDDCCSKLICSTNENLYRCLSLSNNERWKRHSDDLIIPPYYDPRNQLYPYGISKPALPFYKIQQSKQNIDRKNMEWDSCQFHEDCGEGNCCYVHFRFRSLPKWFCRANQNEQSNLCEPLTKYRSLKDVPAWKEQQQGKQIRLK